MGCLQQFKKMPDRETKTGMFMSVDDSEFFKPVLPGDQMIINCEEVSLKGPFGKCRANIYVGDDLVSRCDFKFAIQEKENE